MGKYQIIYDSNVPSKKRRHAPSHPIDVLIVTKPSTSSMKFLTEILASLRIASFFLANGRSKVTRKHVLGLFSSECENLRNFFRHPVNRTICRM